MKGQHELAFQVTDKSQFFLFFLYLEKLRVFESFYKIGFYRDDDLGALEAFSTRHYVF